ncbi:hypothetical protein [Pseudaestuariivita rosea]|uniref:hypothetical protein n=1 Tax=Pseudaestuariivita rosea TaxID=2763263 RepID=UPI001ABA1DA6|nr:hypothetical protein [Pseudaestuariivita rosea]
MSFIRPEVQHFIRRWREVIAGLVVMLFGVYLLIAGVGLQVALGGVLVVGGLVGGLAGYRRARFATGSGGVGVVELDERLITYFAPQGGRSVSIDDLVRLEVRTTNKGPFVNDLFWYLHSSDSYTPLIIPNDAKGVECMFDVINALPGADYKTATTAMTSAENANFVIWQKSAVALH